MSFFSIVSMFFTFIRELLFDSKEEFDYRSSKFNARKMAVFIIIIGLSLATVLLTNRVFNQSVYVVKLKEAVLAHDREEREEDAKVQEELNRLRGYINDLPEKVKKSYPVPSDSGNLGEKPYVPPPVKEPAPVPSAPTQPSKALPPHPIGREERKQFFEEYMNKK